MSSFHRLKRAPLAVLGLSLLLLADGLAVVPGHSVLGAKDSNQQNGGARITSATAADGEPVVCAQGFVEVDSKTNMSLHGVTQTGKGTIAVGYARRSTPGHSGVRAPSTIVNRGNGNNEWTRVFTTGPGDEDGLLAVSWRDDADTWAVGFTTIGSDLKPLAMRWNGAEWKTDRPTVAASVAVFTDVTIVGDGSPFAVGYRMGDNGRRKPLVIRKDGPRWRSIPIGVGRTTSLTLTGVSPDKKGGTWVLGHGGIGADVKPAVWNRDAGKWRGYKLPALKGEAVLTDIIATHGNESWAVGYHKRDGATKALVLRWNGKKWNRAKAPVWDSNDVILNAVSIDPAGGIWVVGAAWNDERKTHEAVAAWWDGRAWNEVAGKSGGTALNDAIGSLSGDGWAVGRSNGNGRAVRVCTPPQAGVFGTSEPTAGDDGNVVGDPEETVGAAEALDADDLESYVEEAHPDAAADNRREGEKAVKVKNKIGTLPVATSDRKIVAKDVAKPAGLYEETGTYDAVVDDFDGDGVDDLFIGRHGRKGKLMLNRNGVFVEHEQLSMDAIDRHGCSSADIDGSGLPDLYCAVGGKRGSGLKSNELWLDPGGPAPVEVASVWGAADQTGRGRLAAFLEAKRQKAIDLVVTNSPTRADGLPSLARLFRTTNKAVLKAKGSPGIAARLGARALQDADYDKDGREDLLLVTGGPQTPSPGGTRLYRNTRKGLVDVTGKMGIKSFDEMDAELVDLNKDGKLDLVQLSETKLKISLQKRGKFKKVFERNLTEGRAIASGDVNGDKRADLYLMRSGHEHNRPDVMLINRGDGRKWSSMIIPQVSGGAGDDAYAIDHDGNGLDDFFVLNGHNLRGPTQLVAFYRR